MEVNARTIAAALVNQADHVTIIYSNGSEQDETGPGTWVRVPDDWFYGRKFRECLRLHRGGIMLQIQADAESDDWPDVVRRCRNAHIEHENLGVWGPELHYTPWNTALVRTGTLGTTSLALVAQTDGIVWSISGKVLDRLKQLDYDCNNLGWGIDWLAIACARANNLLVVRDLSIKVRHPITTSYSRDLAGQQMQAFLAQMTAQESDQYVLLNSFVSLNIMQQQKSSPIDRSSESNAATGNSAPHPARLTDWPARRASDLRDRLRALLLKDRILYSFESGIPPGVLRYFPEDLAEELAHWAPEPFRHISTSGNDPDQEPDVVIVTAHSNDLQQRLWDIRQKYGTDPVIVVWLWDNHTSYLYNKATVLAADLVMPCHSDPVDYLFNPASAVSSHVPLCCAQWSHAEATRLFARYGHHERKSRLLVNYVKYDYATERNAVIEEIRATMPDADVLTMPSNDRSRYFSGSSDRRFEEWAQYKATIILPVTQDLSTRFFDALLAGQIPIVPSCISDLDLVCPPETQDALGIVRIDSYEIGGIQAATREALKRFDAMGPEGVLARHHHVLEHHMLVNRVTAILHTVYMNATGELAVEFGNGNFGTALYQVDKRSSN